MAQPPVRPSDSRSATTYRTRSQEVVGWAVAVICIGMSGFVAFDHEAADHGGYVIAGVGCLLAVAAVRFARCGLQVSATGVRVINMLRTVDLAWEQIKEFKLAAAGPSQIALRDGKWVSIIGVEQSNWAWMTNRDNTAESRIDELNQRLQEHASSTAAPVT